MCLAALASASCVASLGTSPEAAQPSPAAPTLAEPVRAEVAAASVVSVVAVFDVEDGTERLGVKDTRQLGDYLAAQVASIPGTRVVPRDQLRSAIVDTKADSYKACFDQSCQIELGKAVSASKTVATKLLRVGSRCALTTTIYDLKTETTERAATARTDCTADALFNAVDAVVHELGGPAPKKVGSEASATGDPRTSEPGRRSAAEREEPPLELVLDESRARSARESSPTSASDPSHVEPSETSKATTGRAGSTMAGPAERARVAPGLDVPPLDVRWTSRGGQRILRLSRAITFVENGESLDAGAKLVLEQLAVAIARNPGLRGVELEVVGHADARERGKLELSERRARAARGFLVDRGAPLGRIGIAAAADRDPLTTGTRPVDRTQNRRIELRIAED
jgi:outer membrane protein OmpA-like peptidoglycan-associated protein